MTWEQLEFQQTRVAGIRIWLEQIGIKGDSRQVEGNIYLQKFEFKNETSLVRGCRIRCCSILGCAEVLGTKTRIQLELGLMAKVWPNGKTGGIIGTEGPRSHRY